MKTVVHYSYTDIYPTKEEVMELCRPGQGADTCIWLMVGTDGWYCAAKNRPSSLVDRWKAGLTNAKRDGCDKVRNMDSPSRICHVDSLKDRLAQMKGPFSP